MARRRKMDPERKAFINSLLEHYQPKDAQDNYKVWVDILRKLERGTCVLAGRYTVDGNEAMECTPIVCKVI
ncbi:MAG: hypothetical protein ACI4TK_06905 [Agathobacter sp.]